jgi:type VI secretion system protein VasI
MKSYYLAIPFFLTIFSMAPLGYADPTGDIVGRVEQCRQIHNRLKRLDCFDHMFATPLEVIKPKVQNQYPQEWYQAMAARDESIQDRGWILVLEDKGNNAWVALPAINHSVGKKMAPVLLLSCINNLSRVELALQNEMTDARIQVSIRQVTQSWRSDDHGVLFSSARGLPAIEMMKLVASGSSLTLRSNAKFADGLLFDTHKLDEALQPLRERCSW